MVIEDISEQKALSQFYIMSLAEAVKKVLFIEHSGEGGVSNPRS